MAFQEILSRAQEEGKTDVDASSVAFTLGYIAGKQALASSRLHRLICKEQNYAWGRLGHNSKVASLMRESGLEVDDSLPYAEYWFGTHPAAPSKVATADGSAVLLSDWLVGAPDNLGILAHVASGDGQLPFLFKVLSVNKALSIQAHPDKVLGARLHGERPEVYKDPNHKPEMAVALTDFEAMCGFRPYATIVTLLSEYVEFAELVGKDVVEVCC